MTVVRGGVGGGCESGGAMSARWVTGPVKEEGSLMSSMEGGYRAWSITAFDGHGWMNYIVDEHGDVVSLFWLRHVRILESCGSFANEIRWHGIS